MTRPLALAAGSMLDCTAEDVIAAAAMTGFQFVGLRLSGPHGVTDPDSVRAGAEKLGVAIHDAEVVRIGAPRTTADRSGTPDGLIDTAAALGATAVLVVSDEADVARTIDEVGRLVDGCHERGLQLGLEYMAWTTPSTPGAAIEVARATGCVIVVDVLHHIRVGAGVVELDAVVRSGRLGWVQLSDAALAAPPADELVDEARHARLPPGTGELPVRELLACIPPGTIVSVEVQSDTLLATSPAARARLLHDAGRAVLAG